MNWKGIWRAIWGGRRTSGLEGEVMRLRAENRALMNSILGIAGVPPVIVADAGEVDVARVIAERPEVGAALAKSADARGRKNVTPMRRRSWHQVNRMLELDAARKQGASTQSEE